MTFQPEPSAAPLERTRPSRPFRAHGDPATASFQRTKAIWRLPSERVTLGVSTLVCVRLGAALESRGRHPSPSAQAELAAEVEEQGAALLEVRPFPAHRVRGIPSTEDEISRITPILRRVAKASRCPISVVCWNADAARKAVDLGASIIHDPTGLTYDKEMAAAVNESGAALVIGHMRGTPSQWSRLAPLTKLPETVRTEFRASLLRADKARIERLRIVLDPGLEHGKRGHENFNLLRTMRRLGPPAQGLQATLAGRSFLVESIRATEEERNAGLAVAATLALQSGAHILTVADYEAVRHVVRAVDRIYRLDDDWAALSELEPRMHRPAGL